MKNRDLRLRSAISDSESASDQARGFQSYARHVGTQDPRFDDRHTPSDMLTYGTGIRGANGAGKTQLIAQTYNSALNRYEFSGRQDTDAVLIGSRYTITNLTFSFPTSGSQYAGQGYSANTEPASQVQFNPQQQQAVRYALGLVASYVNLTFTEIAESDTAHANLRLSQTGYSGVQSAYGNFPSSSMQAGDVWFGMTDQPYYDTPAVSNWGQATIMHELGHTLGLKHGHQDYTSVNLTGNIDGNPDGTPRHGSVALTRDHDGQDWSLMTYASDPTKNPSDPGFEGEGFNQPQTYMQDDIAALQYLYGANFGTQSGNTTYSWNPDTGVESINGVAQAAPSSNKISMTLWDGNGIDTYDLSNYATNLQIDLTPGAFSTFSSTQLVNHQAFSGGTAIAVGNVANALLYNNDTRSLIENATGGTGKDRIVGNQANNVLRGNGGTDALVGDIGNDTLYGGADSDVLYGDAVPAKASGVGSGSGQLTKTGGFGNVDPGHAANLNPLFAKTSNANIIESTTTPHVTVSGTGDGNTDWYKIGIAAGSIVTLDIDNTAGLDSYLVVFDSAGNIIGANDDSSTSDGAGGSTDGRDSFYQFGAPADGIYYIEVADYGGDGSPASVDPITSGATYQLQVSVADVPAVGSGSGDDILDGGAGADFMFGGAGNDKFYVDNAADKVFEKSSDAGTDRIFASVSYVLAAGQAVEQLTTNNASATAAINLTGNEFANIIQGNAGANVLTGGAGADTMTGFGGNDTYFVDNAADRTFEAANGGSDIVAASVNYTLTAGQEIERLVTTSAAGTAAINLTGNELANAITGNAGANILDGKAGADTLTGNGGADIFAFSTTLGSSNIDKVTDFANSTNSVHDRLRLSRAIFSKLAAGSTLAASAFKDITSGAALDADDRILYNHNTGALFYDADGAGSTAAVQFATLTNKTTLTSADFLIA